MWLPTGTSSEICDAILQAPCLVTWEIDIRRMDLNHTGDSDCFLSKLEKIVQQVHSRRYALKELKIWLPIQREREAISNARLRRGQVPVVPRMTKQLNSIIETSASLGITVTVANAALFKKTVAKLEAMGLWNHT
jgi:hypothetical protein